MQILIEPWVPQSEADRVKVILSKFERIIPPWVYTFTISWSNSDETAATMSVQEEYRAVTLTLGNQWMASTIPHEEVVLHELCHLYNIPIVRNAKECLQKTCEGTAYDFADTMLTHSMERCTEDLVLAFKALL